MWQRLACAWALIVALPQFGARAGDEPKEDAPAVKASKFTETLNEEDPKDKVQNGSPHKVHQQEMKKGQAIVVRLVSKAFDPFLRIEDSSEKQLALNDDEGLGSFNSKVVFAAPKDDTYRIIATSFDGKSGKYTLTIAAASPAMIELQAIIGEIDMKQKRLMRAYQEAEEPERAKILEQHDNAIPFYGTKLINLAGEHPKDDAAEEALRLLLTAPGKGAKFEEALAVAGNLMIRDHLGAENIGQVCVALGNSDTAVAGRFLKGVLQKSANDIVQGQAALGLGRNLRLQGERAYQKNKKDVSAQLIKEAQAALDIAAKKLEDVQALANVVADARHLTDKLTVGKTTPEIEAEDIDGKTFKLSDYRGKVVVLNFWGSWCLPCRAMIPHERELVQRLEKAPFALLGVNSDKNQEELKEFLQQHNMTWRHFWNGGGRKGPISKEWRIQGWPTVYVLDGEGVIRYRDVRGEEMDRAVDGLLKEIDSKK